MMENKRNRWKLLGGDSKTTGSNPTVTLVIPRPYISQGNISWSTLGKVKCWNLMFPHLFLLHTLPSAHHYFPLRLSLLQAQVKAWIQSLTICLCRGCRDQQPFTTLFTVSLYLQLSEKHWVAGDSSTVYVFVPGFWALAVSRLWDQKTPLCTHRSQSAGLSVLMWPGVPGELGLLTWERNGHLWKDLDLYLQRLKAGGENLPPPPLQVGVERSSTVTVHPGTSWDPNSSS